MVLLLCTVSVFEIYSATLHTKFAGFHTKQILWIAGGLVAMFILAKIDYHRLLDWVPWAYGFFLLARCVCWFRHGGHKALGARRWIKLGPMHFQPSEWVKLVLILVVARYFANLGGRSAHLEGHLQGLRAGRRSHAAGADAARPGHRAHLHCRSWWPGCFWAASTCARRSS